MTQICCTSILYIRVTTVHHLHNNETLGSPVENMRRCLLSLCLYPVLGLCRCYSLEQCPKEETNMMVRGIFFSSLKAFLFVRYSIPLGYQWWRAGFEIQEVHHWRQWQTLLLSQQPENKKQENLNSNSKQPHREMFLLIRKQSFIYLINVKKWSFRYIHYFFPYFSSLFLYVIILYN